MKEYFVYILTNASGNLYTGVTNNLERRIAEHRSGDMSGFARRYQMGRLVYFEKSNEVKSAIAREKQVKGWLRKKKVELIESENPDWRDLSEGWH
ncbi:MAG: GIY-YIG nuclease family protein [Candidatus Nitronauta litoralis]|uniref:GIY-YIG nuclease family protein n=1 Tax=Candidatus Nitronauta litoralis TaxID=2705533 RepID=A0A7T0FZ29_9BACT|nr:MAG: GIY-YIG nuclease family protein [Candidatus Nitronauta litoralis]QPJ60888.1 MAG: GIY-YIG nuclease family protein [Candidatus Nitronauta litoralis]QPJ60889.1 MAG: GIY-YIG nuclease family protein [Candidatus Nitronauta litoralis]